MGQLFVTSTSAVKEHGVFAIERKPPTIINPIGTGTAALAAQFQWGPVQFLYEVPSMGEAIRTFAPAGSDRTISAYLALTAKGWPDLRLVRVAGGDVLASECDLDGYVTVNAKYEGTLGDDLVAVVSDASDGDADHFNLTVTLTGVSGSSTDVIKNLNFSGVGADSVLTEVQKDALTLIGAFVVTLAGRPTNGTYTFSGGSDGAVVASDYIGTPLGDAPNQGVALFESDESIDHVCVDDPGDSLRAAVNAGLKAHADLLMDRICYIAGDSGQTAAEARADRANYPSKNVFYCDPWIYQLEPVNGTKVLQPGNAFTASLAAQTSPSTSIAWKAQEQRAKLGGIVDLEFLRGAQAALNTEQGVCTFIKEKTGGFTLEAAKVTSYPAEPSTGNLTRTRMGIYIAKSFKDSMREFVDAPNVEDNQDSIVGALDSFMNGLKRNRKNDPNHNPHVIDYEIQSIADFNTVDSLQSGQFIVPLKVTTSAGMEQIFLSMEFGETVKITSI